MTAAAPRSIARTPRALAVRLLRAGRRGSERPIAVRTEQFSVTAGTKSLGSTGNARELVREFRCPPADGEASIPLPPAPKLLRMP
jgi:hypothetical protein